MLPIYLCHSTFLLLISTFDAGLAGILTFQYWSIARQGIVAWLHYTLAIVSGIAALFLVYNILAGGNPMKVDKKAEEQSTV